MNTRLSAWTGSRAYRRAIGLIQNSYGNDSLRVNDKTRRHRCAVKLSMNETHKCLKHTIPLIISLYKNI